LRILLAEDNPINQKLAVILLQKAGFSVDAVENGLLAVERVKTEKYNAVLMDVQMPEMDGYEATRLIRLWENGEQHIPIIAMTAHALKGDRDICLEAGMDDYLSKPLEPQVLFAVLDRWAQPDPQPEQMGDLTFNPGSATETAFIFGANSDFEINAFPGDEENAPARLTSSPTDDARPLNIDTALPRFFGDRNFFIQMLGEFLTSLPKRVLELQDALKAGDGNQVLRLGHNLKGVASNFSAGPITRIATQMETLGNREDLTEAAVLVEQLDGEARRLADYCKQEFDI
jgi:CheY-like chemotaxis protein